MRLLNGITTADIIFILSEHNKFIDPSTVKLKATEGGLLARAGEEVTAAVHTTAMNVSRLVPWQFNDNNRSKVLQNHVDETRKAGGVTILNHPNFRRRLHDHEIYPVKNLYMFELYNSHPGVHSFGNAHYPNLEQLWDALLEKGMTFTAYPPTMRTNFKSGEKKKTTPVADGSWCVRKN